MTILGIDPGLSCTGFGILRHTTKGADLLDYGYLKMSSKKPIKERIGIFHTFFCEKIKVHEVTTLALETPFLGKNAQNFLKLGYLRGILYLLSDIYGLELYELSPTQVKQSITGWGGAGKEQVATMVLTLFPRLGPQKYNDVTDALAIAVSAFWRSKNLITPK